MDGASHSVETATASVEMDMDGQSVTEDAAASRHAHDGALLRNQYRRIQRLRAARLPTCARPSLAVAWQCDVDDSPAARARTLLADPGLFEDAAQRHVVAATQVGLGHGGTVDFWYTVPTQPGSYALRVLVNGEALHPPFLVAVQPEGYQSPEEKFDLACSHLHGPQLTAATRRAHDVVVSEWASSLAQLERSALDFVETSPLPSEKSPLTLEQNVTRALELFEDAAANDHTEALYTLGCLHTRGRFGLEPDWRRARTYFQKAADLGHPHAPYEAAVLLTLEMEDALSRRYINMGVSHQDPRALMASGFRDFVSKSSDSCVLAFWKYIEVANKGNHAHLGEGPTVYLLDKGDYSLRDEEVSFHDYVSRDTSPLAALRMGERHYYGLDGVPRDDAQAFAQFQNAAQMGHPLGHANMGIMQLSSPAFRNFTDAAANFRIAADHSVSTGFTGLAIMHYQGFGTPVNFSKAAEYFERAADLGSPDAMFNLGIMQYYGHGIPANLEKAYHWFDTAASFSHVPSMRAKAICLMNGHGVKFDCAEAAAAMKQAAEAVAGRILTDALEMYRDGRMREAALAYMQAAVSGFPLGQLNAAHVLEQIGNHSAALVALRMALQQDVPEARLRLGDYHYYGLGGVAANHTDALQLYQDAAEAEVDYVGRGQALFNTAYMYLHGEGTRADAEAGEYFLDKCRQEDSTSALVCELAWAVMRLHVWALPVTALVAPARHAVASSFEHNWDLAALLAVLAGLALAVRVRQLFGAVQ